MAAGVWRRPGASGANRPPPLAVRHRARTVQARRQASPDAVVPNHWTSPWNRPCSAPAVEPCLSPRRPTFPLLPYDVGARALGLAGLIPWAVCQRNCHPLLAGPFNRDLLVLRPWIQQPQVSALVVDPPSMSASRQNSPGVHCRRYGLALAQALSLAPGLE